MTPQAGTASAPLLAVVGDVHAWLARLSRVLDRVAERGADGILLVGDLACAGTGGLPEGERLARYLDHVRAVLDRVARLGRPVAWVPGNHDIPGLDLPGNVDGTTAEVAGLRVTGIGGAGPNRFGFAYEWDEAEIRARTVPEADVLLCHTPPRGTPLDVTRSGQHAGSVAIAERVAAWAGVFVCGHIHEAPGVVQVGDCLCLNAGGLGSPHGREQVGFVRGRDEVWHEDLATGRVQRLRRAPTG